MPYNKKWGVGGLQDYGEQVINPAYWENKARFDQALGNLNDPSRYDDNAPGNKTPIWNAVGIRPDEMPVYDRIQYNQVGDLPQFDPKSIASWDSLGIDPARVEGDWRYQPGKITGGPEGAYNTVGYNATDTASFDALQQALSGKGIPQELLNNWIGKSGIAINRSADAAKRQAAEEMARRGLYSSAPGAVATADQRAALARGEQLGTSASNIMQSNAILGNQNMMTAIPIELQRTQTNAAGQTAAAKYTADEQNQANQAFFDWIKQKAITEGQWSNDANKDSMMANLDAAKFNAGSINQMNLTQYQAATQGQLAAYQNNVAKTFKNTDISNKQIDTNLGQSNTEKGNEFQRKQFNVGTANQVGEFNTTNTINRQNRDWGGKNAADMFTAQASNPLGWANLGQQNQSNASNLASQPGWWEKYILQAMQGGAQVASQMV